MRKRGLAVFMMLVFIFSLAGCASTRKEQELEIQGLKNQLSLLETQLQAKDEEINILKTSSAAAEIKEETASKKMAAEIKDRPNIRQIQIALRNAGYDPGKIDGQMGKQTKNAIKAFQKANNLTVDGKVGKKTWELLQGYLAKKVK